jgi:dienelactone hydrolase
MGIRSNKLTGFLTVAFLLVVANAGNAFATGSRTTNHKQPALSTAPQEEVKQFKGIVINRDPDSFTMSDTTGGPPTTVLLTEKTEVKSHKKGVFRGSKEYAASYILRGLRLEVDGTRNGDGQIVAEKIRFDEQDLRSRERATCRPNRREPGLNGESTGIGGRCFGGCHESTVHC